MKDVQEIRESEAETVADCLEIVDGSFRCAKCEHDLGDCGENYKKRLAMRESAIEDLGRHWIDPSLLVDDEVSVREFFCPNCALRISVEIAPEGGPVIADARGFDSER